MKKLFSICFVLCALASCSNDDDGDALGDYTCTCVQGGIESSTELTGVTQSAAETACEAASSAGIVCTLD